MNKSRFNSSKNDSVDSFSIADYLFYFVYYFTPFVSFLN